MTSNDELITPLLEAVVPERRSSPLPKTQLAAVYAIKILVPLAQMQFQPYINSMIERVVPHGHVGYYSGTLHSAMALAQMLSVYPLGRASDWFGRIPVIVVSTIGIGAATLLLGVSESLPALFVAQFLIGTFCGVISTLHSVVGELSDASNATTAFPLYDVCNALGYTFGPMIGGFFASVASPSGRYNFLLPCTVTFVLACMASTLAGLFLRETNERRHSMGQTSAANDQISGSGQHPVSATQPMRARALLYIPLVRAVAGLSGVIGFVAAGFNSGFTLFAYTALEEGGLGLTTSQLATALSVNGFIAIVLKLSIVVILRRYDVMSVFKIVMFAFPLAFAGLSMLRMLVLQEIPMISIWVAIPVVLLLSRIGTLTFSMILILVKDSAPDSFSLGTTNGLAEAVQSVAVATSSPVITSLFAFSNSGVNLRSDCWTLVYVCISAAATVVPSHIQRLRASELQTRLD